MRVLCSEMHFSLFIPPSDAMQVSEPASDAGMDVGGKELKAEFWDRAQRGHVEFFPFSLIKVFLMKNI